MSDIHPEHRPLTSEDDLLDLRLRAVFRLWQETKVEGCGPASFDLLALPEVIDRCIIASVADPSEPEEAVFTFAGADLNVLEGREMTGLRLSSFASYPRALALMSQAVQEARPLVLGPHQVRNDRFSYMTIEHMCLPLSSDGKSVTGFVYALIAE